MIPHALAEYPQFILARIQPLPGGKTKKIPTHWQTLAAIDAHDPANWTDADTAVRAAAMHGMQVAFVLTEADPFFFIDLDDHLLPHNAGWTPFALSIAARFVGAAVEVSHSGRGFHIIGQAAAMPHACRNEANRLELYTARRMLTLTGRNAAGDAATDHTVALASLVAELLPAHAPVELTWTDEPVAGWDGIEDDDELIERACQPSGGAAAFGGGSAFADLWIADPDALSKRYPPASLADDFDRSKADAALAQHLAFWTGGNAERIEELMLRSALRRDKWEREDYLRGTIARACGLQTEYHGVTPPQVASVAHGAGKLRASSDAQRVYASTVREAALATATPEQARALCATKGPATRAGFWLDNQGRTPDELVAMITPVNVLPTHAPSRGGVAMATTAPEVVSGYQFMTAAMQQEYFKGCVYVQSVHRILTPSGELLDPKQFNAMYGGHVFQLNDTGGDTTRKAWEAFTESQVIRWGKANGVCFRPDLPTSTLVHRNGQTLANCYTDVQTASVEGDVGPFLRHLGLVLPNERDRTILLAYMAACVQHKGVKFQWAPLLQGTEGNGKTLFTRCVAEAVGRRYTHYPKAADIDNKFNGWILNKLFIGVEDIYVPDHKREILETLKPMITGGDGLEIQFKGADQFTADLCANFILNSNHKDAIRKTKNDRRFAVFYTAQQSAADLIRDGMVGDYFPALYSWLRREGYAAVTYYLQDYAIPAELNPATLCHRAPDTSSIDEALTASMGSVEQEIQEAIEEGRPGFAGGWVSSVAVDKLLQDKGLGRRVPHNKRRELLQAMGYDWHPALTGGRTNNPIMIDGGKKPRLFVRLDSLLARNLATGAEVAARYEADQRGATGAEARAAFA